MKIKLWKNRIDVEQLEIYNDGAIYTYMKNDDVYHKVDGPACEFSDGDESWCFEGELHRKYGPARNWGDNDRWWFEGKEYTQEEFMEKFL